MTEKDSCTLYKVLGPRRDVHVLREGVLLLNGHEVGARRSTNGGDLHLPKFCVPFSSRLDDMVRWWLDHSSIAQHELEQVSLKSVPFRARDRLEAARQ